MKQCYGNLPSNEYVLLTVVFPTNIIFQPKKKNQNTFFKIFKNGAIIKQHINVCELTSLRLGVQSCLFILQSQISDYQHKFVLACNLFWSIIGHLDRKVLSY